MSSSASILREARLRSGLTQAELAAQLGLEGQHSISGYETGSVMPESKDLHRLARAVGASVELLLEGVEDMPDEVEKFLLGLPKRTWRTSPCPVGALCVAARLASATSMTTRSGSCSLKRLSVAGPESSTTTRV